jgi:hypothetical protein
MQARLEVLEARDRARAPAPGTPAPGAVPPPPSPDMPKVAPPPPPPTTAADNSLTLGKGVKLTFGGFLEGTAIYRSRNQTGDVASSFNTGIPLPNSPNYHRGEFRGSGRQTRVSALAQADLGKELRLSGYIEADFLGVGTASNSVESNSYVPRIRHAYLTADWVDSGWHLLTGQAYSLMTLNKEGIVPRTEAPPLGPDAQFAVGFNWARQWQLRVAKDWGKRLWLAASLESPQTTVTGGPTSPLVPASFSNTGGPLLNSLASYSTDIAPDLLVKAALEPGWGHYEVWGLGKAMQSRAAGTNHTELGWGIGVGAMLPVIPKKLEVQLGASLGQGIGRYASGGLPDATVSPFGRLAPLTEVTGFIGLLGHPDPAWDVYAYAGTERVDAKSYSVGGVPFGYGNPLYNNTGCRIEGSSACVGHTRWTSELTGGFWWKFYRGAIGTMQFGMQGIYVKRKTFAGLGGSATGDDTMLLTSFRYMPF